MAEAFTAAFLVSAEAALAWALAAAPRRVRRARLAGPLAGSLAAGLLVGVATAVAAAGRGLPAADLLAPLGRLRHLAALALLGAVVASSRAGAAPESAARPPRGAAELALVGGLLWGLPEAAALGGTLRDLAVLAGGWLGVALAALGGAAAAAALGAGLGRLAARFAPAGLAPSAALAALFALKLAGMGAAAVGLPSLAAGFTAAAARAVHDGLHLGFVLLELPDHPYLRDEVYQLILLLLEPLPHAVLAAAALALPLAIAWRARARRPPPAPSPELRPPERRLLRAALRRAARLDGAAFAASTAAVALAVLSAQAHGDEPYEPVPEPVVDDGRGSVLVPIRGLAGGADDGRMHKYVWSSAGHAVTFFTVRKPNGALAVALDACEICQPKGYAQLGASHVFCKYCKTPIPAATVGQGGGCNPVPLPSARLTGSVLRIPVSELRAQHERVTRGKG
jgi:FtrD-like iron-sulfur protein